MTPGFYSDITEEDYHAHRGSLSVSGAKTLLKAPALFRYQLEHPPYRAVWEFGSAVHALVLGRGMECIYVTPFDDWKTKTAQTERQIARDERLSPVTPAEWVIACEMRDALFTHTLAAELLSQGEPEVSAYAVDAPTGVLRRGRFDWLHPQVVVDYKTAASGEPGAFAGSAARVGYHMQAAWYLDLARDLGHPAEAFAFVVQEKEPPYLTTVVELDDDAIALGRARNRAALERFRDCTEAGVWPGYVADTEIARVSLPRWAHYETELETA